MGDSADRRTEGRRRVPFDLGIDMGTTFTAAAVRTPGESTARVVRLERGADQVPSVVLVGADGELQIGGEAESRASTAPERIVREYKRRLGDETPMVVEGSAFSADGLAAETILWAVEQVVEIECATPRRIAISHPAGWGIYRRKLFVDALAEVGLDDVVLLTEPAAAALAHEAAGALRPGATVAVYDLGGGTFDTAVLRGEPDEAGGIGGVTVLGQAQGLENIGGIDFDEALFWHVCAELGGTVAGLDRDDPAVLRAVATLRRACVAAKERLSVDTEAVVEVDLPGLRTRVRVSRTEFEEMIEPALHQTVDVLGEVLDAAGIGTDELDGVLLIGGSSRIPLVARVIGREFGCPVTVDADPTSIVARGAALGADTTSVRGSEPARTVTTAARRHRVTAVTAAVLGGHRSSAREADDAATTPERAVEHRGDPGRGQGDELGDGFADAVGDAFADDPSDDPSDDPRDAAPPRPAVTRDPPPRPESGRRPRHERRGAPTGVLVAADRLDTDRVPERQAFAAQRVASDDRTVPRRGRRRTTWLLIGLVVAVFLVLAATVPIVDEAPGPAAPAPAAPAAPALPGAGR